MNQLSYNSYLPNASAEQLTILELFKSNNIVVDSVAGSGKTTTILHIAKHNPDKKILLLTYNKRLKSETRQKVMGLGLDNIIEVHSYHSFGFKYYDDDCCTDAGIITVLEMNLYPKFNKVYQYNSIILDEAQDMTPTYFDFFLKIVRDNRIPIKLCILGDRWQSIFDFNNADNRFIKFATNVFKINNLPWKETKLSISFRLTDRIGNFINQCVLKQDRIQTIKKSNHNVRYIICDCFGKDYGTSNQTYMELKRYLQEYKNEDIKILSRFNTFLFHTNLIKISLKISGLKINPFSV